MKKDDFRKIYDEIDYTDEFKAEMRKKLSEPAQIRMTSDEYENIVEGVDTMKRNKIICCFVCLSSFFVFQNAFVVE